MIQGKQKSQPVAVSGVGNLFRGIANVGEIGRFAVQHWTRSDLFSTIVGQIPSMPVDPSVSKSFGGSDDGALLVGPRGIDMACPPALPAGSLGALGWGLADYLIQPSILGSHERHFF